MVGYGGSQAELTKGTTDCVIVNCDIEPSGSMTGVNVLTRDFYLWPADFWDGGTLKVALRLSIKALTIRHKRIVIKRRISPRPSRQTDERANNVG
jgi:hypothetical protein